jgi:hypothetical protein
MRTLPIVVSILIASPLAAQTATPVVEPRNLDEFARGIAKSLESPVVLRSAYLNDWREFSYALSLASVWPRPEFRLPLRRILHGEESNAVVIAAGGLLNYGSPALRKELGIYVYDRRSYFVGCVGWRVGDTVREFLRKRPDKPMFVSTEEGLVRRDPDYFLIDVNVEGMTVPIAARALDDADLSIRLQAFIWLAQRGVVLRADSLPEAWPGLGDDERVEILQNPEVVRFGRDTLRLALESIHSRGDREAYADKVRAELLGALSSVSSPVARTDAERIITAQIEKVDSIRAAAEESGDVPLLEYALSAWGRAATVRDLERALKWTRSKTDVIRAAGAYALAGLDDQRAADAAIAHLESPESDRNASYALDIWERLREREWRDDSTKWRYIRYLVHSIDWETTRVNDSTSFFQPSGRRMIERIETLEAITQIYNGETGLSMPGGGVDAQTARATATNWARWLAVNDPQLKPAK